MTNLHNIIKCRLAPSPTGKLHLGNIYVFLYNVIFTRKHCGLLSLRIDDTDVIRNNYDLFHKDKNLIFNAFRISEMIENEVQQTSRLSRYKEVVDVFTRHGYIFMCKCEDSDKCICKRTEGAIFLNVKKIIQENPYFVCNENIVVKDEIKGKIKFPLSTIKNFIIVRENTYPTYHLACIVDDVDMSITHVIRAEDWITSLPKHYLILYLINKFIKKHEISFIHLPLIRTLEGKLSKRENSLTVEDLLNQGFLPQAIENYLFSISMKLDKEIFDRQYCIDNFSVSKIRSTSPLFDFEKLVWFNRKWIQKSEYDDEYIQNFVFQNKETSLCNEDIFWNEARYTFNTLKEILNCRTELSKLPCYDDVDFIDKNKQEIRNVCNKLIIFLNKDRLDRPLMKYQNDLKDFFSMDSKETNMSMHISRFILFGKERGLSVGTLLSCLNKEEKLNRINKLLSII